MPSLSALVGAATAVYSAAVLVKPSVLLGPCGLADTVDTRALARGISGRDLAVGLAMVAAPAGRGRQVVTAARIASDWTDAAALGSALRGRGTAGKVAGVAGAWGALTVLAGVLDARAGR